jgi:hypothetical protein
LPGEALQTTGHLAEALAFVVGKGSFVARVQSGKG